MTLSLAGWTVSLEPEDPALEEMLVRAFPAFVTSAPARAQVRVLRPTTPRVAPTVRALPEPRPAPGGGLRVEGEDYTADIAPEGRSALVTGEGRFPVDTVLKVMLAGELARRGGLLVHGVAVEREGRAALWTGPSGAGKSTLGALWTRAGGTVLTDELVAVWPEAGGWRAAGTPWNVGVPREASLRVVGTLGWDAASRWEPLGAGEVARVLLLNALLPEASTAGRRHLLGSASRLLASVETVRLVFSRDESAADVVRAGLESR
ncbi:hypothetical protein [Vitiosangium sp. GDMCC 1.1324]|uniref:hypothetical protein n=1 Tax=Vitiosangium sp. (strain GDMCC 1.1324) TaxID=2138576 RepID=UPI000D36FDEB|nr:hypothetical protein [Vitiosangium sp. GDMCC 1.1324]PTL80992.1 hypothetical protein DAT35_27110 [Vitiosangium sp. GDMCC 1.1324]